MTTPYPDPPTRARWNVARVYYPAADYRHPASGLLQLRLIRRGSSRAEVDLGSGPKTVFTRPGDWLISLPDRPVAFKVQDGRELIFLQLETSLSEMLVRSAGGSGLEDLRPLCRGPSREPLAAELLRRVEAGDLATPDAQDAAIRVIIALFLALARRRHGKRQVSVLSQAKLRQLLGWIEEDVSRPMTVETLAARAGLSRRTFAAAFKDATDLPVHQYVMRLRLDRATAMLRETALPIADIATMAGFANQAHLTRAMSRLLRQTPKRVREGRGA